MTNPSRKIKRDTYHKFDKARRLIQQDFAPGEACRMAQISLNYFTVLEKYFGYEPRPKGRPKGDKKYWRSL